MRLNSERYAAPVIGEGIVPMIVPNFQRKPNTIRIAAPVLITRLEAVPVRATIPMFSV
jgi:hypothetical protein